MAMTRKAPTVCSAATVDALSSVKKRTRSRSGLSPIDRAWFSSKNATIRSFHFTSRIASETPAMMTSCSVSAGVTASTLPSTIVWMFTDAGDSEIMNRPRPKNDVKIRPMIASSLSFVRWLRNNIAPAAKAPEKNAPIAKGRPSM